MKSNRALTTAIALLMASSITAPALADRGHHQNHRPRPWHGDIRVFAVHDARHWQGGSWHHGHHDNRFGWWWVVGGLWYFYPQPVYPYPDPYTPPVVVAPQPQVIVQQPVANNPPGQYWYYCESSRTYYPYVASCPEGWRTVPATPAR